MEKIWRIISALLFAIFAIICLFAGYVDFKYGGWGEKTMYIVFILGFILCFPRMIKDIASPCSGEKRSEKFVGRHLLFSLFSSLVLSMGLYLLLRQSPDSLVVLEYQMGVEGIWVPLIFFAIIAVIFLIIELFVFYLPRRLVLDDESEGEEEEAKTNRLALIITVVIVLSVIVVSLVL